MLKAPLSELQRIRGARIGIVFQEPMTSLNPLQTIERQMTESLILHQNLTGLSLRKRLEELLDWVGFPEARKRLNAYPHQLSGGQRQRIMMAIALSCGPALLIADEPTTALDVTLQEELLTRLQTIQKQTGMAILLITHHLGIAARMADEVCLLYQGKIVEQGSARDVFQSPGDPYTLRLLHSEPHGSPHSLPSLSPILSAQTIRAGYEDAEASTWFKKIERPILQGISLTVHPGETVGIVGESGSGKTTLALALLRLIPAQGSLLAEDGSDLFLLKASEFRKRRRFFQLIFQDPFASLNPRLSVGQIVSEGLEVHKMAATPGERDQRVERALEDVGLEPRDRHRYPHEFSGGQRQRIAIARALILKPHLLILDEPTSSLDLSIQADVLNLLRSLQAQNGLSYLFISHDLKVIRAMSHRILVMHQGALVEQNETEALFQSPCHPYTKKLLKAAQAFDLKVIF
jgi:microcin C transport system ATP-binding protein